MPTPEFILRLREKIGNDPLWLSGVTAVIFDGDRVLLVRRADTLEWTPVTGIIDPGEHPGVAAKREALEETGVEIHLEKLASVGVTQPITYSNGDETQYLDYVFRCHYLSGQPHPADEENIDVRWFDLDDLPPMKPDYLRRLESARDNTGDTTFEQ